jgi:hypothetical protein
MALKSDCRDRKSCLAKQFRIEEPRKKCQKVPKSATFRERQAAERAAGELFVYDWLVEPTA